MKKYFLILIGVVFAGKSMAQGCSDAGFCSIGALKNHLQEDTSFASKHQSLAFGLNYGLGEEKTSVVTGYLEYRNQLSKRFGFQSKVTAAYASGFLGHTTNFGDIYATGTYTLLDKNERHLRLIGGVKIPVTYGNAKNNDGRPLPLDYQASIGTYDIISGINYINAHHWEFDLAVQAPVIQVNKSTFFADEFSDPRINKFPSTNNFRRKSDALGRIGYYINASSFVIKPSISAIYHLGNDSFEDRFGRKTSIDGSSGVTVNGTIVVTKRFKNGNQLELVAGTPFVVRDKRPDGLTRSAVVNLQYTIPF